MTDPVEQLAADTIRVLAMDAVQEANAGHPGMPMGMADIAVVLWSRFLTVDPAEPAWPDRDRFVLSNGHGSMLLYSMLHLSGFPMPMSEIRRFRQLGSLTPGHPELDHSLGIEMTTGPLGQGFGMGVGMAIAEAHLRDDFGSEIVDHRVYGFVSDGDLMEGVAAEAASLAGHLGLGRLVYVYDDNGITIDGTTDLAFSEDVGGRFTSYGWHTVAVDGHDRAAIAEAIELAVAAEDQPSLIRARTHIAYGAPTKQDTSASHGSPLGAEEIAAFKAAIGWDRPPFVAPEEVYGFFAESMERGKSERMAWQRRVSGLSDAVAREWELRNDPERVTVDPPSYAPGSLVATRNVSEAVIQDLAASRPDLIGGSADLAPSNNTLIAASGNFSKQDRGGRNLRFGIREHAMGAAVNGITLHGGLRAYGATFLTFSDYMRPAVRLAALMGIPSIWVWTHDSIFLGEDGPTHQPIEHLAALRAIPNLWVIRPADPVEVAVGWTTAMERAEGPTALVLTRQGLPVPDPSPDPDLVSRGGYVRQPGDDAVLVATGSEVWVAAAAADLLATRGLSVRVVSLPCVEAFEAQPERYREEVLGAGLPVITVEAGITSYWAWLTGGGERGIGVDRFGESAPWQDLAVEFELTPEAVAEHVAGRLA